MTNKFVRCLQEGQLSKIIRMMTPIRVASSMVELVKTDRYILSVLIRPKMSWLLLLQLISHIQIDGLNLHGGNHEMHYL